MSDFKTFREKFEAYLDGALPESLCAEVEQRIAADRALQAEVEIEQRINRLLCDTFQSPMPPELVANDGDKGVVSEAERGSEAGPVEAAVVNDVQATTTLDAMAPEMVETERAVEYRSTMGWRGWKSRRAIAIVGAAAAVAWIFFVWQLLPKTRGIPGFQPEPVVALYHRAVESGFEPYWECPPERFAATFRERQGTPLRFNPDDPQRQMLGLAYPGGLSRTTTAMLCRVEGEPVMVFVDRLEYDRPQEIDPKHPGTHLFRHELGPLVLYEVSHFTTPQMLDTLVLEGPESSIELNAVDR